jgi:hypothetical protein
MAGLGRNGAWVGAVTCLPPVAKVATFRLGALGSRRRGGAGAIRALA